MIVSSKYSQVIEILVISVDENEYGYESASKPWMASNSCSRFWITSLTLPYIQHIAAIYIALFVILSGLTLHGFLCLRLVLSLVLSVCVGGFVVGCIVFWLSVNLPLNFVHSFVFVAPELLYVEALPRFQQQTYHCSQTCIWSKTFLYAWPLSLKKNRS